MNSRIVSVYSLSVGIPTSRISSIFTDNAPNVALARTSLCSTLSLAAAENERPLPGALSIGCHSHMNGIMARELCGVTRREATGEITRRGEFNDLVLLCALARRVTNCGYPHRFYQGTQILLGSDTRWVANGASFEALHRNYTRVIELLDLMQNPPHWNK